METNSIEKVFADIQDKLDSLQGSDETFMFFSQRNNRGVIAGDDEELEKILLFNMLRYDIVAKIFTKAVAAYKSAPDAAKEAARARKPRHEIYVIDGKEIEL
jgi:hypothetical protein